MKDFFRRYLARFVMNACTRGTSLFRDEHQSVAVDISKTDVCKGGGQAYFFAEGENDGRFFRRGISELKSGQNAKSHFFAVVIRMRFFQRSESVVNGMSARQATAFKADST